MEILLIRHFMTRGNAERRYIGTTDEALLPGQTAFCPSPDVQAVAVSPLRRCIETAEIICPGVRRYVCDELRECDFGLFENKNYEELKDDPDYQRWILSGGKIPFPKGEGRDDFCRRCEEGFCRMTDRFIEEGYESAAFVVHGGTIMAILDRFAAWKEDFYHWQVKNGEAYRGKICEREWSKGIRRITEIERV